MMEIRYAVFIGDYLDNITDIDEEITSWFIPLINSYFPNWEFVLFDTLVKADDGNEDGYIWIGWMRNAEGKMYNPNWVPPEDPPEEN